MNNQKIKYGAFKAPYLFGFLLINNSIENAFHINFDQTVQTEKLSCKTFVCDFPRIYILFKYVIQIVDKVLMGIGRYFVGKRHPAKNFRLV